MRATMLSRYALLLLAFLLVFSSFALSACADETDLPDDEPATETPETPDTEEPEEEIEPEVLPDVPEDGDYAFDLNVMHWTVIGLENVWTIWEEICPDEEITSLTGDLITDDIYNRTEWIRENYGINVTKGLQEHNTLPQVVANMISSGSDEYQMLVEFGFDAQRVFGKNYFLDLASLDYIDFEKPWWVDSAISELSLGDYVEFGVSDMLLLDKASTTMTFYNVQMATDLGISGLYEDVENNKWTIETMAEYAEMALTDDGDGEWTDMDTYGIISGDDPTHNFYIGAGLHFLAKDQNGDYYYQYGSDENTIDVMITILDEILYQDFYWNTWQNQNNPNISFKDGSALFSVETARSCNSLRHMDDAYGILPNPLYDEYQEQYYSQVSNYGDSMFAVFNTAGDPSKVAAAIELLSYYSYYNVYPDFYDVVIQGRGTRDAESKEMLEIIFNSRTYDLGLLYDPNSVSDAILRYPINNDTNIASFLASWEDRLDSAIDNLHDLRDAYN